MMRFTDAVLLARTKLKTRRIRLGVLLVTMSILFSGLVFGLVLFDGSIRSVERYGKEGLGSRFIVQATPMLYQSYDNETLINSVRPQQEQLIAQKKALAKKLNLTYDPATDQSLYYPTNIGQDGPMMINFSKLGQTALNQQNETIKGIDYKAFQARASQAGATSTYLASVANFQNNSSASLNAMTNGREKVAASDRNYTPTGIDSINSLGWSQTDKQLLKPFALPNQSLDIGSDGSVPIVAPFSAAEQILGLRPLPATASSEERLQRLAEVRQKAAGIHFDLCYRNAESQRLVTAATNQITDIAANKNKKDYQLPALLYNAPTNACEATTVKSDKRSAEDKKADANQRQFDETFGLYQAPVEGLVKLRIVGLNADVQGLSGFSASSILQSILYSSVGSGWYSPSTAFSDGQLATVAQTGTISTKPLNELQYYAEFPNIESAKAFIETADCTAQLSTESQYNPNEFANACAAANRPYMVTPYGNNAGAIQDIKTNVFKYGSYVVLGLVIISCLVMIGTFGKVIADSRRETAVFRSLGASRVAIAQIYLTYSAFVGLIVAVLAVVIGATAAAILSHKAEPGLSVGAAISFNASDLSQRFTMFYLNPMHIAVIVAIIVAMALISAIIPILLNIRRNPIKDMRED